MLLSAALLLSSCSGNDAGGKKGTIEVTDTDQNVSIDNDFVLPQPVTLAEAFKAAGLKYKAGMTNPVSALNGYAKKSDQLLNLGVYSTDLAYCALNGETQQAREYLAAIRKLADKTGLESIFSDREMLKRFEQSIGDAEALTDMIYEIQEKTDAYLQNNDLRQFAAVQFAGAWTEGMYLGLDQWLADKKPELGAALTDQMNLLENTVSGLKSSQTNDARITQITDELGGLLSLYNGFASVKKAGANPNFEVPGLSAEEGRQLSAKVKEIRTTIVTPAK
jgi:hypothetical protein